MVRRYLEAWADRGEERHTWLLVNCGLHDVKVSKENGDIVISQEAYRDNLQAILAIAPTIAERFAWIRTTPIDDERQCEISHRFQKRRGCLQRDR